MPVTQRTREIGIRMAIGAAPSHVLAAVLRQSLMLTGIGAAMGMLVAADLTSYLESMLFELTPLDPPTFVAVAVLFLVRRYPRARCAGPKDRSSGCSGRRRTTKSMSRKRRCLGRFRNWLIRAAA
jgi:hypothetical protein